MDYKETLNLPQTDFPMKANLQTKEVETMKKWEEEDLYGKTREAKKGKEKFILHDGPPYANGNIHMGHALNKILKDIIVRHQTMEGKDAPYVPGWDCHGLPIEHQVDKKLGKKKREMTKAQIRQECRDYAGKFIDLQKEQFKRLGIAGNWGNPYLTMDFDYEARIVNELYKIFTKGYIYKGKKPIHWCINCVTALAEAEIEYQDHQSESVFVRFNLEAKPDFVTSDKPASIVIWTTTPWTLPANLAVCINKDYDYVTLEGENEVLILAEERVPVIQAYLEGEYSITKTVKGDELLKLTYKHPFIDRSGIVIEGDHVTLEQGSGCVHTAPGHGQEDYIVGLRYNLDILCPVDDRGIFHESVDHFGGEHILKANSKIVDHLRENGYLIHNETIDHSYPHCWRCKKPVVFRAAPQWFISMSKNDLKKKALEQIKQVKWYPAWGENRINSMVENRPDWCISRQRSWGVPIMVFACKSCEAPYIDQKFFDSTVARIREEGCDIWFDEEENLLPEGATCECGCKDFTQVKDILDVWFDSGVSHEAVMNKWEELTWPADLYLEGSDQHRGWFQSSLLTSTAVNDVAPYKSVLTHGYVVDGKGKKMSKSEGNVMVPDEVIKQYGAEIIRLWVVSENYRDDMRISKDIIKSTSESYRKIRNTFRFMLGNISDFNPATESVAFEDMDGLDRYILAKLTTLIETVRNAYRDYEFHVIYHSIVQFCIVDMSNFYLDIIKDRLYTQPAKSAIRLSSQTAIHIITQAMVKLLAPVCPFTMEEVWQYLKSDNDVSSVHLTEMPELSFVLEKEESEKWETIAGLKKDVSKALEEARREKLIGHPLDAKVELFATGELAEKLQNIGAEFLQPVFITSGVEIVENIDDAWKENAVEGINIPGLFTKVGTAEGEKCSRCWVKSPSVGENEKHPTACTKCTASLEQMGL